MRDYFSNHKNSHEAIRSDARENKTAIVLAARKVYSKIGPDAAISEITKEAGVSRSTFYRNFPDKQELIVAIYHYNLDILEKLAKKNGHRADVFILLLERVVKLQVEFMALAPYVSKAHISLMERLYGIFSKPIEQAKKGGLLRKDFSLESDLDLLLQMMGAALLNQEAGKRNEGAKRALQLILEGIHK